MSNEQKLEHMLALKREIDILKEMLRPHDTGHIHTTISMLESRVKWLHRELFSSEVRQDV
tara:strand:- start:410 stop:589 length:180 start_codon:yes stop_codon:yes gene_type:complete